jgi:metal-sulfur cluster biosynthetic enzyme
MDVEEIKQKKQELSEKIAVLLNEFEDETGVQVSDVGFVRRVSYDELGREVCKMYVTEVEVKL